MDNTKSILLTQAVSRTSPFTPTPQNSPNFFYGQNLVGSALDEEKADGINELKQAIQELSTQLKKEIASPLGFLLDLEGKNNKLTILDNMMGKITKKEEIKITKKEWDVLRSGTYSKRTEDKLQPFVDKKIIIIDYNMSAKVKNLLKNELDLVLQKLAKNNINLNLDDLCSSFSLNPEKISLFNRIYEQMAQPNLKKWIQYEGHLFSKQDEKAKYILSYMKILSALIRDSDASMPGAFSFATAKGFGGPPSGPVIRNSFVSEPSSKFKASH